MADRSRGNRHSGGHGVVYFQRLIASDPAPLIEPMDYETEYRKQADQARELAAEAETDEDRRFWLGLAGQWDALAEGACKQGAPPKRG